MNRIKLLNESTTSQIAAGEVIERPSAIVREMLDNALDAESQNISITLTLDDDFIIEIRDDGRGIPKDDFRLAFKRHATSKITKFEDVFSTKSLGFRGEALASIASISHIEAISCTNNDGQGFRMFLEGGKTTEEGICSSVKGSYFKVSQIFYNTPVRKKFMKTFSAEKTEIKKHLIRRSICLENISLKLEVIKGGKRKEEIFISNKMSMKDKIAYFHGPQLAKELIKISSKKTDTIKVDGYISSHRYHSKTRKDQYFIIKNRIIQNTTLSTALNNSYINVLPSKHFASCFLTITLPDKDVDINIHPAKKEVKFRENDAVFRAVYHTIKDTLYETVFQNQRNENNNQDLKQFNQHHLNKELISAEKENTYRADQNNSLFQTTKLTQNKEFSFPPNTQASPQEPKLSTTQNSNSTPQQNTKNQIIPNLEILGQLKSSFIVYQISGDLFIADQHAIHERINFDAIKEHIENNLEDFQYLLIPLLIQRSRNDIEYLLENKNKMKKMGLEFELFGDDTISFEKIPLYLNKGNEGEVIHSMIDGLLENKHLELADLLEKLISTMACRMSIFAGDSLTNKQMFDLITTLYKKDYIHNCPHGRPFIKKIELNEIMKFFDR